MPILNTSVVKSLRSIYPVDLEFHGDTWMKAWGHLLVWKKRGTCIALGLASASAFPFSLIGTIDVGLHVVFRIDVALRILASVTQLPGLEKLAAVMEPMSSLLHRRSTSFAAFGLKQEILEATFLVRFGGVQVRTVRKRKRLFILWYVASVLQSTRCPAMVDADPRFEDFDVEYFFVSERLAGSITPELHYLYYEGLVILPRWDGDCVVIVYGVDMLDPTCFFFPHGRALIICCSDRILLKLLTMGLYGTDVWLGTPLSTVSYSAWLEAIGDVPFSTLH
ncbi:hypothetical protein Tco_1391967 [Tanacetum coccineum]